MKIYPLIGFDKIKFGYSRTEVTNILGEPTTQEKLEFLDGGSTDSWFYEHIEVELNFDSDDQFKLTRITFSSQKAEIDGVTIVGKTENDLKKLFPKVFLEDEIDEVGNNFEYPEKEISFWVVEKMVKNFTIFVPFDSSGENVQWPK